MENEVAIEARRESSRAAGRTARHRMPRAELGRWAPTLRDHDPVVTIESQNAIRLAALASLRHERMSVSAWNFYRGAAAVMARDLGARGGDTGLTVQLCGDAHILNFGLWATPERNLAFDLRDFDETLPGPFEWDVARLVASIHVLARDSGLDATTAERAVAACLASYRERMSRYAEAKQLDIWYDRIDVEEFVSVFKAKDRELATRHISRKARRRSNRGTVAKITDQVDGELRITIDEPVRVRLGADEVAFVEHIFDGYHDSLQEDRRHLLDRFTLVDMVRQVVGVGSVGMRVYLLLLEGRDGRDPLFLQIKQAGPSAYEDVCGESSHANHGQRVVTGKRIIQSATDIFVGWTTYGGIDFYVRQFRDMKVIPDGRLIAPRLAEFAGACGSVLARSHAKSGDPVAIASYIGKGRRFDEALGRFAIAYADQNEADHAALAAALEHPDG